MNYTKNKILRLFLSSELFFIIGSVSLLLSVSINSNISYYIISIAFIIGVIYQVVIIFSHKNKFIASFWFFVALITFAGDVVSTLIAVRFDYRVFLELEANPIFRFSLNSKYLLESGLSLALIKLFVHLWLFSLPVVWVIMKNNGNVDCNEFQKITHEEYFIYTRFRAVSDSWQALFGKCAQGCKELHFATYIQAHFLVYTWGILFTLLTISNYIAYASINLESRSLQMLHRFLFVLVIVIFLVSDTVGFYICRNKFKINLKKHRWLSIF